MVGCHIFGCITDPSGIGIYPGQPKFFTKFDLWQHGAIAARLDISPNTFSWFLNEHHQVNFFTYINSHRTQHAIDLLNHPDYQHYTLEAISQLSGFKSKTTFNNRFKEITGLTPSNYRRKMPSS